MCCLFRCPINFSVILILFIFISTSCSDENTDFNKPDDSRFSKIVLAEDLSEPIAFDILKDGRVLFAERNGRVRVFDPANSQVNTIADIPVSMGYYSETGEELSSSGEDGMLGLVLDPNYDENHWIYLFYSPARAKAGSVLVRYEWVGDELNMSSEVILLEVPNQRQSCCHLGGGMVFDKDGNLYLSTGDNTPNDTRSAITGYTPIDERPGESRADAQRTSGNTNDLRGKILRIRPESDGTYSIPEGNLFPKGTFRTRPELYTMGNRNPWRLSIDSKTQWLYWGEVGPHGTADSVGLGPRSYDEFNQAKQAENFGWPYFLANNKAYWEYDYEAGESGGQFQAANPTNNSPNNTGLTELPPAKPAFIWYPQTRSTDFPIPGSGSNSAVGGPIYRRSDFINPARPFPAYYEGKWFITDWTRGWIMVVTIDENGDYVSMEPFLPNVELSGPIDMKFGPDGDLYILEYGRSGVYRPNPENKLVRIEYNDGNRAPVVKAAASKTAGAVPLNIRLSSDDTKDHDGDVLEYDWRVTTESGQIIHKSNQSHPNIRLDEPGKYQVTLAVNDPYVTITSESIEIIAGNEPPEVSLDFISGNKSFFFPGYPVHYSVQVNDREDGSLSDGRIPASNVKVSVEYVSIGNHLAEITRALKNIQATESAETAIARQLISATDCQTCHRVNEKLAGPAFTAIADKYKDDQNARSYLTSKIIFGSSGVWGDVEMPPHPGLSEGEVNTIARYILNIRNQKPITSLPVNGVVNIPDEVSGEGSFLFRASYTDSGTKVAPSLSATEVVMLRNSVIHVLQADEMKGMLVNHAITSHTRTSTITPESSGAYIVLKHIDLAGIKRIGLSSPDKPDRLYHDNWVIQVKIDSPTGELIGQAPAIWSPDSEDDKDLLWAMVDINSITDVHDIFIVLSKNDDSDIDTQMRVRDIRFVNR